MQVRYTYTHTHTHTHAHTQTQKVRPSFYDFSMPVLTAAGAEEIFIASELFYIVLRTATITEDLLWVYF